MGATGRRAMKERLAKSAGFGGCWNLDQRFREYSMEWLAAVVSLLTQGWPLAAVIIAIVFRKDISAAIPRIKKAGPLELDAKDQQQKALDAGAKREPKFCRGFLVLR